VVSLLGILINTSSAGIGSNPTIGIQSSIFVIGQASSRSIKKN
jgi:hypothetical protein